MQLLRKLHQTYVKTKEGKAPNGSKDDGAKKNNNDTSQDNGKGRKPNFFERNRFLNYEKTPDSDDENTTNKVEGKDEKNKKEPVTKEIKDGKIE